MGAHLFQNCITGLLANKTRIFITNQLQYVPAVDVILVLKDGQLVMRGSYEQLMSAGNEFQALMKNSGADSNSVAQGDLEAVVKKGKADYKEKKKADKVKHMGPNGSRTCGRFSSVVIPRRTPMPSSCCGNFLILHRSYSPFT